MLRKNRTKIAEIFAIKKMLKVICSKISKSVENKYQNYVSICWCNDDGAEI